MLLIKILIYFQNFFITQAAVMKITNLPLTDHIESEKVSYQAIYNNDEFIDKNDIKRDYALPGPVCKEELSTHKSLCRGKCDMVKIDQKMYQATHFNGDAYIEKKSEKGGKQSQRVQMKWPAKREALSNITTNGNFSSNSSKVNDSYSKVSQLIHPDLDNFYDSELIRKLSDCNGKLPTSLKLVIPPDKEPMVVYNESEDNNFNDRNFFKREAVTPKSNVYYDYNYYEEQQSDNSQLNPGPYNARKKFPNERQFMNEPIGSLNATVEVVSKEIHKPIAVDNDTKLSESTSGSETYLSFEPFTVSPELNEQLPVRKSTMFQVTDSVENRINLAAQRRGTCPPEVPGKQGCHPGGGIPKYPMMPSLLKKGKDPEYEKLMKGETSERVIKEIVDKIHKNPSMALELGICDFDLGELRSMFKKVRSRDKKECCSRLSGEFKCFLTWLLTMEPARKKRADMVQEETSNRFLTCNQFPKFDLMGGEYYKKPSPQYEKLVQRVEEYKDETNVK